MRNPFSLKLVGDRVFVNDNGPGFDRFIEVSAGDDFLYDGSNESIAMNTLYLWSPSVSPVQMDYNPVMARKIGFPDFWGDSFFITLSGSPMNPPGRSNHGAKSVIALGVDVENGRVIRPPEPLLNYRGSGKQLPVGLTVGPDGLYIVPLMPDSDGNSTILKMTYSPEREHSHIINELDPSALFRKYSCQACHRIDGNGIGSVGPEITRYELGDKLLKRLTSIEYTKQIDAMDLLQIEPFLGHLESRDSVRAAQGEEKARTWLINRLMEPRFDQEVSLMPNLGIPKKEAEALAGWLLASKPNVSVYQRFKDSIKALLPTPPKKTVLITFILGTVLGIIGGFIFSKRLYKRN